VSVYSELVKCNMLLHLRLSRLCLLPDFSKLEAGVIGDGDELRD